MASRRIDAVPVMRPALPKADRIRPHIDRIDENRWYTNHGPLLKKLETEIGARFGLARENVVTVCNGTLALAIALRCKTAQQGYCLLPSWTFVGCAHAVNLSGLTPFLCDVSRETGTLTTKEATAALAECPGPVRAVMPVNLFGEPVSVEEWEIFERETGVKVVLDCAAGFDTFHPSSSLGMISLHATKLISAGEGALLITRDDELADRVRRATNFGFSSNRVSEHWGINAKMSEYSAAVALADLEFLPDKRRQLTERAERYRSGLSNFKGADLQKGFGENWIGTFLNVWLEKPNASQLIDRLKAEGIETRMWWGGGLHRHPEFGKLERTDLSTTNQLANCFLGLPFWVDLPMADIDRVVATLRRFTSE